MPATFRPLRLALALAAFVTLTPSVLGQTTHNWTNAAGGNWNVPTNWDVSPTFLAGAPETLNFGSFISGTAASYTATNNVAGGAFTNIINFNNFAGPAIIVANTSSLTFNAAGGTNPALNLNGFGLASINAFTLGAASPFTIGGSGVGNLALTGVITNTNENQVTFNQSGGGFLGTGASVIISGTNNFGTNGNTVVNAGNVVLGNNAALGSAATNTITVNGGTFRHHTAAFTLANDWTLNSNLEFRNANGSFGDLLTGVLSGNGGIVMDVNQNFQLNLQNTNTFSGNVVGRGSVGYVTNFVLSSNVGQTLNGSILNVPTINLPTNSSLIIDNANATTTGVNRIGDGATVILNRANLVMQGNTTLAGNETFGTLQLTGFGVVTLNPGNNVLTGAGANLTITNLVRNNLATLQVNAPNLGSAPGVNVGSFTITNNPGGDIGGILPYAIANNSTTTTATNNWVRWNSGTQRLEALAAGDYINSGTTAGLPLYLNVDTLGNYRQNVTQAGLGATSVNSLILETSGATAQFIMNGVSGSGTLNVNSGAVMSNTFGGTTAGTISNTIAVNTLNFGSNPGYFHTPATLFVTSQVAGTGGISRSGGGALFLFNDNTFSGHIHNQFGNIVVEKDSNLGAASNEFRMYSGFSGLFILPFVPYTTGASNTFNSARNIVVEGSGGSVTVANSTAIATLTGTVSGGGYLAKGGAGVLVLDPASGANTFQGRLQMSAGVTMVRNDAAMGAAGVPIEFTGSAATGGLPILQPMTSFATNRNVLTNATGTTAGTGAVFYTPSGINLTLNGVIGTVNHVTGQNIGKIGAGDLIMTGTNTYNGATTVGVALGAAGGQVVPGSGATGSQAGGRIVLQGPAGSAALSTGWTLNPGATLVLDNSGGVNPFRVGMVGQSHTGSELVLIGNSAPSANTTQAIGAYTSNSLGNTITLNQPLGGGNETVLRMLSHNAATNAITFFRGTNLGAGAGDRTNVIFNTPPALDSGILKYAVGATSATGVPTDFVTVVGNTLQIFGGYVANNPNAGAAAVTDINAATVLIGASTVGAARISGNGAVDLAGFGWTVNNAGNGHLLSTVSGGATISNSGAAATIAFGANGRITNTSDLTLGTGVTPGGTTITKFGQGTLILNQGGSTTTTWNVAQGTLRYGTGVTNALPTGATVTLGSGAALDLNNNTGVTLANIAGFGTVNVGTGGLTLGTNNTVFMGSLQGSGAITMNASNTFTVSGNSPNFSGNWNVNAGTVSVNSNTALGSGTINLGAASGTTTAGLTAPAGAALTTISNPIVVTPGGTGTRSIASVAGTSVVFTGTVTHNGTANLQLTGPFSSTVIQNGAWTLAGNISGTGPIQWFGGNWNLHGDNSGFSGTVAIDNFAAMVMGVGTDTALGTGTVTWTTLGGMLRADNGARTLANAIVVNGSANAFSFTGMNDITLTGPMTLNSTGSTNHNVNVVNKGTTTFAGVISAVSPTAPMSKTGFGDLVLSGANTFAGGFTLNSGALGFGSSSGTGTGPVGTGTFTINATNTNGAVIRAVGGPRTVSNAVTVNGDFVIDGSHALTLGGLINLGTATSRTVAVTSTSPATFSGGSTGTAGLTKQGAGTLVLTGTHSYQGTTNVNRGTLQVDGTLDSSGTQVNVNLSGTLSGTGTINRAITINAGGTIKPGSSPGVLTIGSSLTMSAGSTANFQIQGVNPGNGAGFHSQIFSTSGSTIALGSGVANLVLDFTGASYTPAITDRIVLIDYSTTPGALTGFFAGLPDDSIAVSNVLGSGLDYYIYYGTLAGYANKVVLSPVPEPMHILLVCGAGVVGYRWVRRRTARR